MEVGTRKEEEEDEEEKRGRREKRWGKIQQRQHESWGRATVEEEEIEQEEDEEESWTQGRLGPYLSMRVPAAFKFMHGDKYFKIIPSVSSVLHLSLLPQTVVAGQKRGRQPLAGEPR